MQGYSGTGRPGQRLLREHPAHVGHQQHHHLDQGQPHLQLRRQLPPVVAAAGSRPPDFTGNFGFDVGFTGRPGRGLPARLLHERLLLPARGASAFRDRWATRVSSTSCTSPPTSRTTGRSAPKLTLNLGLRYDYRSVPYETNDHMGWRNLDYAPGGLLVADQTLRRGGINDGAYYQAAGRRNPENPDRYKVFAPRIGFAYRPADDGKTVIRGGYGMLLRLGRGPRDRRRRGYLSVREPRHLSAVARPDDAAPDDRPVVPELPEQRRGDAGRQHLPRREHVSGAQEPLRPAVVPRRPAAAHRATPSPS